MEHFGLPRIRMLLVSVFNGKVSLPQLRYFHLCEVHLYRCLLPQDADLLLEAIILFLFHFQHVVIDL